ncbi:hypothetical protein [Nocardia alba]|nr:hypothetical protein [Nocardia alba]
MSKALEIVNPIVVPFRLARATRRTALGRALGTGAEDQDIGVS